MVRRVVEGIQPTTTDEDIAVILKGIEEQTLVAAHTHVPLDRQAGPWHILNPGTVGMPLLGRMEATYLILDGDWTGWRGILRNVPFSSDTVIRDLEALHFVEDCGVTGALVLEEYRTARLRVAPFLNWRRVFPDETDSALLARFLSEVDPEDYMPVPYRRPG
jgi:hypothetical protein